MQLPLVYVHGFIGHMRNDELRHGLEPSRVLTPDLLGYGRHADAAPPLLTVAHQVVHLRKAIERVFGTEPGRARRRDTAGARRRPRLAQCGRKSFSQRRFPVIAPSAHVA